jgi:hypothetical protein
MIEGDGMKALGHPVRPVSFSFLLEPAQFVVGSQMQMQ